MQLDAFASHQSPLSVILLFVVFVGFSDGIAQGAIFGDVALLPPKYTQVCSLFLSCQTDLWITCCMPIPAGLLLLVHMTVSPWCACNKCKSIPEGILQEPSVKLQLLVFCQIQGLIMMLQAASLKGHLHAVHL